MYERLERPVTVTHLKVLTLLRTLMILKRFEINPSLYLFGLAFFSDLRRGRCFAEIDRMMSFP